MDMASDTEEIYDSSAAGSLAGFLWQQRLSLLYLLKSTNPHERVTLETDDDVCVCIGDQLVAAIQAKHSFDEGPLTTSSIELWSTLRGWINLGKKGRITADMQLRLAATGQVPGDSRLACLVRDAPPTSEEVDALVDELDTIASGDAKTKAKAYAAWNNLKPSEKKVSLLNRVRILNLPQLSHIDQELRALIRAKGFHPDRVSLVLRRIEGWFGGRVAAGLTVEGFAIAVTELWDELEAVRRGLGPQLSHAHQADEHPDPQAEVEADRLYVRQLKVLGAEDQLLVDAVHAVLRATNERDDWRNASLTSHSELEQYDNDLFNKWKQLRARHIREGNSGQLAPELVGWKIHDSCMEYHGKVGESNVQTHVACGSYHMLADKPRIGWHPQWESKLGESGQ